ncbi:MAG: SEL1-like repeat protein [Oleispira sp.]|nr:SEL1-like repeat protein [Oleispira sp.]MBL4880539.1 SEL1-like repeat protein [Oleispira sp.]
MKLLQFLALAILPICSSAEVKVYEREYTYKASESDSKLSSRNMAVQEIKLELLNELGTHIYSELSLVNNENGSSSARQELLAVSSGIIKLNIIEDSWNGVEYYLKARLKADSTKVSAEISKLEGLFNKNRLLQKKLDDIKSTPQDASKANETYSSALKYQFGLEEHELDLEKAFRLHKNAANAGHVGAQRNLGHLYEHGKGVRKDLELAIHWYSKAAMAGDQDGQVYLGGHYYLQGNPKAIYWLEMAANNGSWQAQFMLGEAYKEGKIIPVDIKASIKWYEKSADKVIDSQYLLGQIYSMPQLGNIDVSKAIHWYTKAASSGYSSAQLELGYLYWYGSFMNDGSTQVNPDPYRSIMWFDKAATGGEVDAMAMLGSIYMNGNGDIETDYSKALKWLTQAVSFDDERAQLMLGMMYFLGIGIEKNTNIGTSWLVKARDQGDPRVVASVNALIP